MECAPLPKGPEQITPEDWPRLSEAIRRLSCCRGLSAVMQAVREAARELAGADGVTFILREGELVHYADESAIARLWKGQRFPASSCISGWAIRHRQTVVIEDVFADPRIPSDLYRPTFVKSLAVVPIRLEDPIGAIGVYWASAHLSSPREQRLLEALAGATAVAMENADLYRELLLARAARDEFLNIASHELRTPLTPLKVQVQALLRSLVGEPDRAALARGLARIQDQVARLERLADHLLDGKQTALGRMLLDFQELDLARLTNEAVERLRPAAARVGCELRLHAPGVVLGSWDRLRLARALDNLLSNALKFGAGRPVEIAVGEEDDRVSLSVRDHGPGMSADEVSRVLGRFERASSRRHFGGLGLGLWIVRQTVEAHRGELLVETAPGGGACFRVLLPRWPLRLEAARP